MQAQVKQNRSFESVALIFIVLFAALGFAIVTTASQIKQGNNPLPALPQAMLPPLFILLSFGGLHVILRMKRKDGEQVILPATALLFSIGLVMVARLRGMDGAWQQITRGLIPGIFVASVLLIRPQWIEYIRRYALQISLGGLLLLFATAVIGRADETGARLALKLGPLPAIQTSEIIKITLIIFLAWYIEEEGREAEARARPVLLGWLRLPAIRYFIPGLVFVSLATLALVRMADWGAVLIMGCLFVAMLFAGFETRLFVTVAAIGLALSLLVGLVLAFTWHVPEVIRLRFLAFRDPWSQQVLSNGLTVSEGPGYQIQQAVYAVISGGLTGTGLGLGSPAFVPLAHSDFIFAAILEELGAVTGLAMLALYTLLVLRILRVSLLLPRGQVFERLLLIGIGVHLFIQVLIMVGGTLNLMPLTGVTVPFASLGGMAVMVNMIEIGIALALSERLEGKPG